MEELTNQSQETNQETNSQETNTETNTNTETQNNATETDTTQNTEQNKEQNQTTQKIKVKFNHEEKEIPYEEATKLIQKGMNYDKVHERYNELANNPALAYLSQIAEANGVTVEQIVEYWQEEEKQAQIAELAKNNIPEEFAKEVLEARQLKAMNQQKQKQQKAMNQMFKELVDNYPDLKAEDVPDEVWQDVVVNNRTLLSAYSKYENRKLKEENSKLKQGIEVKNKNQENANLSTGSATGNGKIQGDFISKDTFDKNKSNQSWVINNLDTIKKSRTKW